VKRSVRQLQSRVTWWVFQKIAQHLAQVHVLLKLIYVYEQIFFLRKKLSKTISVIFNKVPKVNNRQKAKIHPKAKIRPKGKNRPIRSPCCRASIFVICQLASLAQYISSNISLSLHFSLWAIF
jgi:hypothetical protein